MRRRLLSALLLLAALLAGVTASNAAVPPDDPAADPQFTNEGWLEQIGWSPSQLSTEFPPAMIGIADSGLAVGASEFEDQSGESMITPASANCRTGRADPAMTADKVDDRLGHGTALASLSAAPINGRGLVGVSPYSSLVVVSFTDFQNDVNNAPCAINWLARQAVGTPFVANLSFGVDPSRSSSALSSILRETDRLVRAGALVVAAVGNRGTDVTKIQAPASAPHTLAVGDRENIWLVPGRSLDLVAPGDAILTPKPGDPESFTNVGGTSYATPLVSGAAALVWGAHPEATAQQIGYALRGGATGRGIWGGPSVGFGVLSIRGALKVRLPADDEIEPDDVAGHPTQVRCARTGRCRLHGILVSTDDTVDYWRVRGAVCPRRFATRFVSVRCTSSGSAILIRAKLVGSGLRAYTLSVR